MPQKDPEREERIVMEIIVDCYDEFERAAGWWVTLDDRLQFPFKARCIKTMPISLLKHGEEVEVIGMAPQENCESDMIVIVKWQDRTFGVPLEQLEGIDVDKDTQQIIGDWHYWVEHGYAF